MTLVATEAQRYSNLVKEELWHEKGYCTKQVTVNDAAQTLALGTVLGQVTVGGKYKVAKETASDGCWVSTGSGRECAKVQARGGLCAGPQ